MRTTRTLADNGLLLGGSTELTVNQHTAAFAADANGEYARCDATAAAFAATLPACATTEVGVQIVVKKVDASVNAVTVTASGSDRIDGAATLALSTQYAHTRLINTGSAWDVIG